MRALRKRGKALGVVAALAGLMVFAAVAFADNTVADGDGVEPVGPNALAFGDVDCDEATNEDALIAISRNGSATGTNTFKNSASVAISVLSVTGDGLSAQAPASSITLPSNWGSLDNTTMSASVASEVTIDSTTEGAGTGSVTYRATGLNSSNATITRDATMAVTWTTGTCTVADTTAPVIQIDEPDEGDVFLLNESVLADFSCTDEEANASGLKSCVGDVADGSAIDTASVGAKTFTVNAEDNAGNTSQDTHNYSVIFDFDGFFAPVDTSVPNKAKAGSSVPVKFSLDGDQGLSIFDSGYPQSRNVPCSGLGTPDPLESTANPSLNATLTYDATTDRYNYVWKTEKNWAATCRQLVVKFIDGEEYSANFQFTK